MSVCNSSLDIWTKMSISGARLDFLLSAPSKRMLCMHVEPQHYKAYEENKRVLYVPDAWQSNNTKNKTINFMVLLRDCSKTDNNIKKY